MTAFIVYKTASGNIVRSGTVQDALLGSVLVKEDETLLEGASCNPREFYVLNGQLVQYTPEQHTLKRKSPNYPATWDNVSMSWIDLRELEAIRETKRAEINRARLRANFDRFSFDGKEIACDTLSRSDIDGVSSYVALFNTLPPNFPGAWKTIDNSYVSIPNVAKWKELVQAMVAQGTANFLHSESKKAAIASATLETIHGIGW